MQYFFVFWWLNIYQISWANKYIIRLLALPNPIFFREMVTKGIPEYILEPWLALIRLSVGLDTGLRIEVSKSQASQKILRRPGYKSQIFWVISGQMLSEIWRGLAEKIERFENWSRQFSLSLSRDRRGDLGDDAVDIFIMMECICVFLFV